MSKILTTIELDSGLKDWIEWFSFENQIPFSQATNQILELGQQILEGEAPPLALTKTQKLLIQCAVESLVILKKSLPEEEKNEISAYAKNLIKNTLGLVEQTENLSS